MIAGDVFGAADVESLVVVEGVVKEVVGLSPPHWRAVQVECVGQTWKVRLGWVASALSCIKEVPRNLVKGVLVHLSTYETFACEWRCLGRARVRVRCHKKAVQSLVADGAPHSAGKSESLS